MSNQHLSNNHNKSRQYNHNDEISAAELTTRIGDHEALHILDVREPIEYHTYNIGGLNLPVGQMENNLEQLDWNKTDEIIVICQAGIRSETACAILQRNGFEHPRNLKGGLIALRRLQD